MSTLLPRARILREHHRHEEAVAMLHQHLAQEPDDAAGHLELALNRFSMEGMLPEALEDARRGTGLRPGDYFGPALQARILCKMGRYAEALPLADAAVGMDPAQVYAWNSKTMALCELGRQEAAEQSGRHARSLDPGDADAANLLALVLRLQGKLDESVGESRGQLGRDPENGIAFANLGWVALGQRRIEEAEGFFKEALRLRPHLAHAQAGLKEAYHQRSAPYRFLSAWSEGLKKGVWMSLLLLLIALPFGFLMVAKGVPPGTIGILSVAGFFAVSFYFKTITPGLARLLILRDPVARFSLERREKVEGVVIAGLVFGGAGLVGSGLLVWRPELMAIGSASLVAALPVGRAFSRPVRWLAFIYFFVGALILLMGMTSAMELWTARRDESFPPGVTAQLFTCGLLAGVVVLVGWRGKGKATR